MKKKQLFPVPSAVSYRCSLFTLIELLVVIAIIAILAAMLMPALQKARDRAAEIECLNKMTQIGKAVQQYVDDFQGFKPMGNASDGKQAYWYAQLGGFQNTPKVSRYLANPFSFDDNRQRSFWYCKKYTVRGNIPRVTYGVNKYQGWRNHLKLEYSTRVDDIVEKVPQLSRAAYVFCGVLYGMDCTAEYENGWRALHNGGESMPVLYLDGHCGSITANFLLSCLSTKANKPLNRAFWGVQGNPQ